MRRDMVGRVVDDILNRIADGRYSQDRTLPSEVDLATELDVSRLTVREAVKVLRERGILRVVQGRGTYLTPRSAWTDLPNLISMTLRTTPEREVGLRLIEVRRMIEVGAAGLAAVHRCEADVRVLEECIERIDEAGDGQDVPAVVEADMAFHSSIMEASGNPFVPTIMIPLSQAFKASRAITSADPEVRRRAQWHHREILRAIRSGDEQGAKDAMRSHMTQTRADLLARISASDRN